MKTTVHVHRQPAPAVRPSTLRLGMVVSVAAALAAIVLRLVTDVPQAAVVLAVIVIAFAVSWHATFHDA